MTAANWSAAANGDVQLDVVCDFGTSDEAVGTVTHWSFDPSPRATTEPTARYRRTTIGNGDSFEINTGTIQINGSTT